MSEWVGEWAREVREVSEVSERVSGRRRWVSERAKDCLPVAVFLTYLKGKFTKLCEKSLHLKAQLQIEMTVQ